MKKNLTTLTIVLIATLLLVAAAIYYTLPQGTPEQTTDTEIPISQDEPVELPSENPDDGSADIG